MNALESFRLDGKTALVTGARRGIGKAMAIALAEAGADIIAVSATLEESGSQVENEVRALGRGFAAYRCDFADRAAIYDFVEKVRADHAAIDILVNNAGTVLREPAERHPDEYWDRIIAINLDAQFLLSREIGKGMLARGSGKIIFTASLLTFQGGITVPGYAASKGGIGSLPKRSPMNGPGAASRSTPSPPVMCARMSPKRCRMTRSATRQFWNASRPDAGATRMTSRVRWYSWLRPHLILSTARSWL